MDLGAARVTVLGLRVSVSLLHRFLPPRATRRQKSDTKSFSATLALLNLVNFVKELCSRVRTWKPSEKANMNICTGLPHFDSLALRTLVASQVATQGIHSRMLSK